MLAIWLSLLVVPASCALKNDLCTGWGQVQVADATVDYLAQNDDQALREMIANQRYGQTLGCW